jgi:hypothetical protein
MLFKTDDKNIINNQIEKISMKKFILNEDTIKNI